MKDSASSSESSSKDISKFLTAVREGDPNAVERLLPMVYDELRKLAAQLFIREQPDQTLQPTALVHEAYVRLLGADAKQNWAGRGHFFAAAAQAMRRILVDAARRKGRIKHGGSVIRHDLDLEKVAAVEADDDLLDLHEALENLARHDPIKAKIVELRYFAGMTLPEAAGFLGISSSTADRTWRYARAWLYAAMDGKEKSEKS